MEIDRFAFNLLSPEIQMSVYRKMINTSSKLTDEAVARATDLSKKVRSLASYSQGIHDDGNDQYAQSVMIQDMIKSFPRLPIQINKLTTMLLDEGASVSEIVGFAKMDPSIVSVVLKTVNSGYYSFQRKISDFHHAFVLLGFNQVYQILMENFLQGVMPKHFNLKELNLHSAVISQIAFDVAQVSEKSKPVMMSTLGILHDLGKCVVLVSKAKRPELDLILARLDDSKIGSLLLDTWNTPGIICESVEYQLHPRFCPPEEIPEDCRESVATLYIAHLCFDYLRGKRGKDLTQAFSEEYMSVINLSNYSIENLVSQHILPSLIRKIDVFPDYVRDFINNNQTTAPHSSIS
jgi:HD-like signal output (HDOD) protein